MEGLLKLIIAIGSAIFVGYYAYKKQQQRESPHHEKSGGGGNSRKPDSSDSARGLLTYNDIKPSTGDGNEDLRHRKVRSVSDTSKKAKEAINANDKTAAELPLKYEMPISTTTKELKMCDQETQCHLPLRQNVTINTNDETAADLKLPISSNNEEHEMFNQENQYNMLLHQDETNSSSYSFSEVESASSVTSEDTETVCSWASDETIEDIVSNIPTWDEMSDAAKILSMCSACGEHQIETISEPCRHPYFCKNCAYVFFRCYGYCVIDGCRKKISYIAVAD